MSRCHDAGPVSSAITAAGRWTRGAMSSAASGSATWRCCVPIGTAWLSDCGSAAQPYCPVSLNLVQGRIADLHRARFS